VLTSDRDLFQLVSPRTTVLVPRRGVSELDRVDPNGVRERYGVDPAQVPDFIALRGDSSDKIPGAKGIGPGRAATILSEYDSLDGAIEGGVFQEQADALRTYLRIARLQYEAPVPELPDSEPRFEEAADLLEGWGHGTVAKRLRDRG
jgi:DNA polymerase-1